MWSRGTKVLSETSPELGVGVVLGVDGRYIDVFFPDVDKHLRLSTTVAEIEPIELAEGDAVRLRDRSITRIERIAGPVALLADGSRAPLEELWPHIERPTLVDHLANSEVDPLLDVLNRVDGQRVLNIRQRTETVGLIGARVEIVPHQVATAARVLSDEVVRWLLADEPGLGRMTVACMVAASMLRAGRAERVVIVAPHRRAIGWLEELYRNFHQTFVHVDHERWRHVQADFGIDANPFEIHPLCVVSSGLLASEEVLVEHLRYATPDLAVVDEAHQAFEYLLKHLLVPLTREARHALVLTASREVLGEEGLARFAEALRPGCSLPEPHDGSLAEEILDAVPDDFDETLRRFCLDAAERVELEIEKKKGEHVYYFEYGPQAKIDSLLGLAAGARFLGTFDRRTALEDESLEFFASGHPLVEGLLSELQMSDRGRVGAVRLRRSDAEGFHGLYLLVVERDETDQQVRLVPLMDASGPSSPSDDEHRARALYASLDMGIELEAERVESLMGRVANHPLLERLDATTLSQAILVAVMDHD